MIYRWWMDKWFHWNRDITNVVRLHDHIRQFSNGRTSWTLAFYGVTIARIGFGVIWERADTNIRKGNEGHEHA